MQDIERKSENNIAGSPLIKTGTKTREVAGFMAILLIIWQYYGLVFRFNFSLVIDDEVNDKVLLYHK